MKAGLPSSNGRPRARRIGYLLRMYPRFSQTFVVNEILELERQGLDLSIVSLRKPNDGMFHESVSRVRAVASYLPESGLEAPLKTLGMHWEHVRRQPAAWSQALRTVFRYRDVSRLDLIQAAYLVRWAKKNRIDHLHVHFGTNEAGVAMLARMLGGPSYSLTLHAFDIFRDNVDHRLLAEKINASAFIVTVTEFNRRYLLNDVAGVRADKVRVNYNGIDLDRFKDEGAARDPLSIFGVGRLIEKKGFADLVSAVERLRAEGLNVCCDIAGDGPEESKLREQIRSARLEGHVRLAGPLKQDEVRTRLQTAGCFVLPCVRAKDGNADALPTVLLESLACGCPSVSTKLSGVPEIIEDGVSGLLAEPGDVSGLAQCIRRIMADRSLADRLARDGRRRAEDRFDVQRNVRVMHEWLLDGWTAHRPGAISGSQDLGTGESIECGGRRTPVAAAAGGS